jgi:hypothetical protein
MIWIVLTVIFAVLKLVGIVAWLWVFSPLLVMLALAFLSFLLVASAGGGHTKPYTDTYWLTLAALRSRPGEQPLRIP